MTTTRLLATDPYPSAFRLATQPAFLRTAGQGRISTLTLSQYLSQDRLYQYAYVRFVGQLLSKLRFETTTTTTTTTTGPLARRIMDTLIDALIGIQKELGFFEAVAARYGFGLEVATTTVPGPTPITRAYADFFASVSGPGASLLEGLVALWGTEKCYLEAWRYAKGFISPAAEGSYERDADGGAIRKELLPNWTSEEFGKSVEGIGLLVDEVAAAERERLGDEGEWKVMESRCDEVWRQILWLEERFWPDVEGKGTE
jgi:thiaminase